MFSRFSGVSAELYGRQTGQIPWVNSGKGPSLGGSKSSMNKPGGVKALGQSQGTTRPLCLCSLQRQKDAERNKPDNQARRSM